MKKEMTVSETTQWIRSPIRGGGKKKEKKNLSRIAMRTSGKRQGAALSSQGDGSTSSKGKKEEKGGHLRHSRHRRKETSVFHIAGEVSVVPDDFSKGRGKEKKKRRNHHFERPEGKRSEG